MCSATWVVISPNLVHSAVSLLITLFSVAGLYVFLYADFLAATQVVIYVGGILVLIIFGVMLTNKIDKILAEIKTLDGFTDDIEQKLIALKPVPVAAPAASPAASAPETTVPVAEIKKELFSMKELNDIEDIKIRAGLKKIYMTSKKEGLSNDVAINNMLSHLENENQMNDKIKEKLENLK